MIHAEQHLTIHACDGLRLRLDGPALYVAHANERPRWFPLQRLSLVTLVGNINIESALVRELATRNIPLRFMAKGKVVEAVAIGIRDNQPRGIGGDLDAFQDCMDWRQAYVRWRLRQEFWAGGRALSGRRDLSFLLRCRSVVRVAYALHGESAVRLLREVRSRIQADALTCALQNGWPPDRIREPYPGPNLIRDLTRSMLWEALRRLASDQGCADVDRWFARNRRILRARARLSLESLIRFVRQETRGVR